MSDADPDGLRRRATTVAALGAALVLGAALLVLGAHSMSSDLKCESDAGDSNYGEAEWTWVPLGTTCRWTEERNGFDRVEEIGWGPTAVVAVPALLGVVLCGTSAHLLSGRRDRR